jgi:hypothetical protein
MRRDPAPATRAWKPTLRLSTVALPPRFIRGGEAPVEIAAV